MTIDYDHAANRHSTLGPQIALPLLLGNQRPASILDVGCGIGTWLRAAQQLGIDEVFGVDGVDIPEASLLVDKKVFVQHDLSKPLRLGRRFEVVLCLEVAEHLEPEAGEYLITSLTQHADTILFSAACPGQFGQHHVNCQWPSYWQAIFNARDFVCDDAVRWRIWTDSRIDLWYRQNIFCARRDASSAGHEPRIASVIHPEFLDSDDRQHIESRLFHALLLNALANALDQISNGRMPARWYVSTTYSAVRSKLRRYLP